MRAAGVLEQIAHSYVAVGDEPLRFEGERERERESRESLPLWRGDMHVEGAAS